MSKITESARGEECTVRIIGVCTGDPAKTIWSHARWGAAGRGRSIKAPDICGAYCCTDCDAVYDGQRPIPIKSHPFGDMEAFTREQIDADWCQGHFRSLVILKAKGLV